MIRSSTGLIAEAEPLNLHYGIPELPSAPLPEDRGRLGNAWWRFTILFAILVVAVAFMPMWLSLVIPNSVAWVNAGCEVCFAAAWLVVAFNAVRNYNHLNRIPMVSWDQTFDLRSRCFKHIVVVPCHLEPASMLHECVDTLTFQTHPERLVVVISFEASTPELQKKLAGVRKDYREKFGDLLILVHQLQRNELAGGCSNKNFALREAYKYCSHAHGARFKIERYTITTCDTDAKFHPRYFECLEAAYNEENPFESLPVKMCVWQPPMFYNWDLDERPFFSRITCIMRTALVLGCAVPFNLNPVTIYSYPLELGHSAGYVNPRYEADDVIAKVRWMVHTESAVPIKLLPCAVVSGPEVGDTLWEELLAWLSLIQRWIVGASESFHYFVIHWRGSPFFSGLAWLALSFECYGVLLCASSVFTVLASVPLPWVQYPVVSFSLFNVEVSVIFTRAHTGACLLVFFAVAFVMDAFAARRIGILEDINPARNLMHWLLVPLVVLVYSLVALVAVTVFAFRGRKVPQPVSDALHRADAGRSNSIASGTNAVKGNSLNSESVVEKYHNDQPVRNSVRSVASVLSERDASRHVYVPAVEAQ